ncbi:MAG: hypothetical protein KY455_12420 [Euryarchaeota archaeon]|nr:hypothetical protein [Euryarchaeota archaeon]
MNPFAWRPIASYDEIHAERRRRAMARSAPAAVEAVSPPPPSSDAVRPHMEPMRIALQMGFPAVQVWDDTVAGCRATVSFHVDAPAPHVRPGPALEAPNRGPLHPLPTGKTEKRESLQSGPGMDRRETTDFLNQTPEANTEMAKYLSKEWVEAGREHVEHDRRLAELTRGIRASVLCVVRGVPDHADEVFYVAFDDGRIIDLYSGTKQEFDRLHKPATFEVHGDYNTYMKIQEGHLTQTTAVMRGMLKLKGSWLKALRYIRALEEITTVLREVPTEY